MDRNKFLKTGGLGMMGSVLIPTNLSAWLLKEKYPDLLGRIGIQLFSLPKLMEKDLEGTLKMLSEMGYTEIELFGPYPFSAESNKVSWGRLTPMLGFSGSGYFGLPQGEFVKLCRETGLRIPSMHTDLDTLENHMGDLAEAARGLGATYVTLPAIPPERRQTTDDYRAMAETFNKVGEAALSEGIRFAYHNHGYGLQPIDGVIPFEMMIEATDPDKVYLEMDIFWTTAGRADPVDYLTKYRGRYKMMHLKDMRELKYFTGDGGDPSQWMELFPLMASAGSGVLELDAILKSAVDTGVEHFFVEQDLVADPGMALKNSFNYLDSL
jgi:sugar phosphate isomerase/epimerase